MDKAVKPFQIKQIMLNPSSRTLSLETENRSTLVLIFNRDVYFDFVYGLARLQSLNRFFYRDSDEFSDAICRIMKAINKKLIRQSEDERARYSYGGKTPEEETWSKIWRQDFTWQRRKYVKVLQRVPESLTDQQCQTILTNLFNYHGSGENATFWLGDNDNMTIYIPEGERVKPIEIPTDSTLLGKEKLLCVPLVMDTEELFEPSDIQVTILEDKLEMPPEIMFERENFFREYEKALSQKEEYPWPGTTYGIQSFSEIARPALTEKPKIHITLRPTDYFMFMAVQKSLDQLIFNDRGRPITLREKYLSNFDPFTIVPHCAQAVSATVALVCKHDDDGQDYILIMERSRRKMLATGQGYFVLSINETPKRKPTPEELKFLENVSTDRLSADPIDPGGPFFHAVVRGAKEELGIELPIETIRFFCFNMEPKRYQFAFIGLAETDLTVRTVTNNLSKGKDFKLEYTRPYWVRFTPEEVYDFMRTHRPWGSEAEIGLYLALCCRYKDEPDRVDRLFRNYAHPLEESLPLAVDV